RLIDRVAARGGLDHAHVFGGQHVTHEPPDLRLIIDHEHDVVCHALKSARAAWKVQRTARAIIYGYLGPRPSPPDFFFSASSIFRASSATIRSAVVRCVGDSSASARSRAGSMLSSIAPTVSATTPRAWASESRRAGLGS